METSGGTPVGACSADRTVRAFAGTSLCGTWHDSVEKMSVTLRLGGDLSGIVKGLQWSLGQRRRTFARARELDFKRHIPAAHRRFQHTLLRRGFVRQTVAWVKHVRGRANVHGPASDFCQFARHDVLRNPLAVVPFAEAGGVAQDVRRLFKRAAQERTRVHSVQSVPAQWHHVATARHGVDDHHDMARVHICAVERDRGHKFGEERVDRCFNPKRRMHLVHVVARRAVPIDAGRRAQVDEARPLCIHHVLDVAVAVLVFGAGLRTGEPNVAGNGNRVQHRRHGAVTEQPFVFVSVRGRQRLHHLVHALEAYAHDPVDAVGLRGNDVRFVEQAVAKQRADHRRRDAPSLHHPLVERESDDISRKATVGDRFQLIVHVDHESISFHIRDFGVRIVHESQRVTMSFSRVRGSVAAK